jgi:hypothetical protein
MSKSNNSTASKKENPSHEDGLSSGVHGTKDDSECSSLRIGNLPKSEKVREISNDVNAGKAVECARKQNVMDDGQLAQVPAGRDHKTTTGSGN